MKFSTELPRAALLFVAALGTARPALPQTHSPAPGSAERKAILDSLRPRIEAQAGTSVEFQVKVMRVHGTHAYVYVRLQRPGGSALSTTDAVWSKEPYADAFLSLKNGQWSLDSYQSGQLRQSGSLWEMCNFGGGNSANMKRLFPECARPEATRDRP